MQALITTQATLLVQAAVLTWGRLLQYAAKTPPVAPPATQHGSRGGTAATPQGSCVSAAATPGGTRATPSLTSGELASTKLLQDVLRLLMGHPKEGVAASGPWPQLMSQASASVTIQPPAIHISLRQKS